MMVVAAALLGLAVLTWPHRSARGPATFPRDGSSVGSPWRSPLATPLPRLRPSDRADDLAAEAAYCEMLALALRAGLSPPAALEITDSRHGLRGLPDGDACSTAGIPGTPTTDGVPRPGRGGRLLALAWAQSEELGTPLADAVATCAAARQSDHGHELRRRALHAGPRASMQLLTALPLLGPGLAWLAGLAPDLTDPVVVAMLVAGLGATGSGWWWARSIVARADRPVRVERVPAP